MPQSWQKASSPPWELKLGSMEPKITLILGVSVCEASDNKKSVKKRDLAVFRVIWILIWSIIDIIMNC